MNKEIHELLKIQNDKTTIFTNKELKMIDDYIKELESYKYNMDRDYLRLEKVNKELNKQIDYLSRSVKRKEETIIDLQNERVPYTNEYVEKLENQQKEFIEYLEKTIVDSKAGSGQQYYFQVILSKYKEILKEVE